MADYPVISLRVFVADDARPSPPQFLGPDGGTNLPVFNAQLAQLLKLSQVSSEHRLRGFGARRLQVFYPCGPRGPHQPRPAHPLR